MRLRPLIVGAALTGLLGFAFFELAEVYGSAPAVLAFDASVSQAIQSLRTPWLTAVMRVITVTGDTVAVTAMTIGLVALLWTRGHRRRAKYVAAAGAVGAALSTIFKGVLGRARPPVDDALITLPASFSFPSGHAMASLCLGWAITYVTVRSRWSVRLKAAVIALAVGYAVSVAVSRVYLGVHWPSDILASWLLGGAWLAIATGFYEARRLTGPVGSTAGTSFRRRSS